MDQKINKTRFVIFWAILPDWPYCCEVLTLSVSLMLSVFEMNSLCGVDLNFSELDPHLELQICKASVFQMKMWLYRCTELVLFYRVVPSDMNLPLVRKNVFLCQKTFWCKKQNFSGSIQLQISFISWTIIRGLHILDQNSFTAPNSSRKQGFS